MRKLLPFILAFAIVVCLAACKDKNEPSGGNTIGTSSPPDYAASQVSQSQNVGVNNPAGESVPQTYVLTTAADMTVPTVLTTAFNVANESVSNDPFTTQKVTTDISLTVATITAPVVNTTALPSVPTVSTTDGEKTSGSTESKTTTKKKQEATTSASAKAAREYPSARRNFFTLSPTEPARPGASTLIFGLHPRGKRLTEETQSVVSQRFCFVILCPF